MARSLATIGVYGTSEASFFGALKNSRTTHFVDIRVRRGMRGHQYAYANSSALQRTLAGMGVGYVHELGLAPTEEIRLIQKEADRKSHTAAHDRTTLSPDFAGRFRAERLAGFDFPGFVDQFPADARIVLFCVEHEASACHRSLVADAIAEACGLEWEDITP